MKKFFVDNSTPSFGSPPSKKVKQGRGGRPSGAELRTGERVGGRIPRSTKVQNPGDQNPARKWKIQTKVQNPEQNPKASPEPQI